MALSKDWSIFAQDLESKSGVTVIFCYSLKTEERSSAAHTHWQWYTFSLIIFLVWNGTWIYSNSWSCQIFSFCCSKYCIKDMPSSVTQWCLTLWHHGLQHAVLPCPSPTPKPTQTDVQRIGDAIQPSHPLSSPSLQSFPASGSFRMSQFFASGGQSIGVLASASDLPMSTQDWFPLGLTGLISLHSKGLSRVFSNTTVQKHQFFGASVLYSPTLTSIHEDWKNHSLD